MEMKETWTNILRAKNIIDDENRSYFSIVINDGIQLFANRENQSLDAVPSVSYNETSSFVAMQQVPQGIKANDTVNIENKEKDNSGAIEDEEVVSSEWSQSSDEEPLASLIKNNKKGNSNAMIWEDLRPMFPCDKCSYGSKKRYLLMRHLKTHYKDGLITGEKLNPKHIDNEGRVDKDNNIDVGDGPPTNIKESHQEDKDKNDDDDLSCTFTCTKCPYNTGKRYLWLRHFRIHSGERPYKCKVCDRGFKTGASLRAHTNMHYGVKNYNCQHCEKSFTTFGELSRHVKYKHTQDKQHKCTECDYAAVERDKVKRHMRYHHTGERPYQCQHCSYASHDTHHIRRHMRKHTGEKPYKCDNCNASYAHSTSLKLHKTVHNPSEKPAHPCELCPAKNTRKCDLLRHIKRIHFPDTRLRCMLCGEVFTDRYLYKLHNEKHENEKCFKCQLCKFESKKFVHLKRHMILHTGLNSIDNNQSLTDNDFLRHQFQCKKNRYMIKEKCHKCQICKRIFAYKGCLIRHAAIHVGAQSTAQEKELSPAGHPE